MDQKTSTIPVSRTLFDLRPLLGRLASANVSTVHNEEPIELGSVAAILEGNDKAVLFTQVGPEKATLVGNLAGSRQRLAMAFQTDEASFLRTVLESLRSTPGTREVAKAEAPVQDVVLAADQADFTMLPTHLQHGMDGARRHA